VDSLQARVAFHAEHPAGERGIDRERNDSLEEHEAPLPQSGQAENFRAPDAELHRGRTPEADARKPGFVTLHFHCQAAVFEGRGEYSGDRSAGIFDSPGKSASAGHGQTECDVAHMQNGASARGASEQGDMKRGV